MRGVQLDLTRIVQRLWLISCFYRNRNAAHAAFTFLVVNSVALFANLHDMFSEALGVGESI